MRGREDERIAGEFLESLQLGNVDPEPDGNVTPDFVVNGKIAVEVRRLNQNYELPEGKIEGFEGIAVGGWKRMERITRNFGPSIDGECWNVIMQLKRPIDWKKLEPAVIARLTRFKLTTVRNDELLDFGENFQLDLWRGHRDAGLFFNLKGQSSSDAGGPIMAMVERNLRICVEEKQRKVAPFRHKYNEWWLVLINRVDLHMERQDYENFGRDLTPPLIHSFDRIIIVDPWDYANSFDI